MIYVNFSNWQACKLLSVNVDLSFRRKTLLQKDCATCYSLIDACLIFFPELFFFGVCHCFLAASLPFILFFFFSYLSLVWTPLTLLSLYAFGLASFFVHVNIFHQF